MKNMTTGTDVNNQKAKTNAEDKAKMSLPNYVRPRVKQAPTYQIPDQSKLKNIGVGLGGEKPVSGKIGTSTGYMTRKK